MVIQKRTMTVDGLSLEENLKVFLALKDTVEDQVHQARNVHAQARI